MYLLILTIKNPVFSLFLHFFFCFAKKKAEFFETFFQSFVKICRTTCYFNKRYLFAEIVFLLGKKKGTNSQKQKYSQTYFFYLKNYKTNFFEFVTFYFSNYNKKYKKFGVYNKNKKIWRS